MIREPAVAGGFYPYKREELENMIKKCFEHELGPKEFKKRKVVAGIVPHAGYIYSGPCAAWFYSRLSENKVFVIIGPNHTGYGYGFSLMAKGKWRTPLGLCEINEDVAREILEIFPIIKDDPEAHIFEHSIEVQLPFLQYLFGEVSFVPIVISSEFFDPKYTQALGNALKEIKDIIVISSSDFTHYGPWYGYYPYGIGKEAYEKAVRKDLEAIEKIVRGDINGFWEIYTKNFMTICGAGPIIVSMSFSGGKGELLKYYTSADITGDFSNFVGYASIVF